MEILNAKDVAKLLKSSPRTIERKAQKGYYPPEVCGKHGRYWLFDKEKLIEFVFSANKEKSAA